MLRTEAGRAVEEGQFRIYAVSTVDEGISILTGAEAGVCAADGKYPDDSVNGRVAARLSELSEGLIRFNAPPA